MANQQVTGNDRHQGKKTTEAQRGKPVEARERPTDAQLLGEQPSQDPQLRKIHERAHDDDGPGRDARGGNVEGGSRHDTQ